MILPNKLDTDRLHDVIEGRLQGRRTGKTVAILMRMLGEVWLGDPGNEYVYIGENRNWTTEVMREFRRLLEDEGQTVEENFHTQKMKLFTSGDDNLVQTFSFLSAGEDLERWGKGRTFARVFIDVTAETGDRYNAQLTELVSRER